MTKPLVRRALWYSDSHIPYQDNACLSVVKKIIKYVQPNILINGGDLIDARQATMKFAKDPLWREWLQDDIDQAAAHLSDFGSLVPDARKIYLLGNHEERLERLIAAMTGPHAEIVRLRQFQKHVNWQSIMREAGLVDWEIYDYGNQYSLDIIPNLLTIHGRKISSQGSAYAAAAELRRLGRSGISGHTHRLGAHYRRSGGVTHVWWEAGCTCLLNPSYMEQPDWQQACLVIDYTKDWFRVNDIFIEDGFTMFESKEFNA